MQGEYLPVSWSGDGSLVAGNAGRAGDEWQLDVCVVRPLHWCVGYGSVSVGWPRDDKTYHTQTRHTYHARNRDVGILPHFVHCAAVPWRKENLGDDERLG